MKKLSELVFVNSFAGLSEDFYSRVQPSPMPSPYMISFSKNAAALIDLEPEEMASAMAARVFIGEEKLSGADPLAMLYSGHQFGHYNPQLGDGRAIMLGEVMNAQGGRWELQLKGAGPTPYSRSADGRAVLRSSVREYLCSEAMAGLGIPTTRALCLVGSDEEVYREQIESGAMLLRMAPSHVRFGSFEIFYYRHQYDRLKQLADYVIEHHYPELADQAEPYLALLREVVLRTARLMAQWQLIGFSHGVMNTDNMSVLGLTLDYGPFGFLDRYDPGFICNHSDHEGRYAFDRQPSIGLWNLTCFAQALLPLLDEDNAEAAAEKAEAVLKEYEPKLIDSYATGMRAKLGLRSVKDIDQALSADLLDTMHQQQVDFTLFFRNLGQLQAKNTNGDNMVRDLFIDRSAFDAWAEKYRARLMAEGSEDIYRRENMQQVNPKFVLRNHLAQQAIEKAQKKDYSEIERLLKVLSSPFDEHLADEDLAALPPEWASEISVSCSS